MSSSNNFPSRKFGWFKSMTAKIDNENKQKDSAAKRERFDGKRAEKKPVTPKATETKEESK